jgi:HlyD family type I secretion membrane fusion protein
MSSNDLLENERQLQQMEARISDLVHDIPRTEAALSELAGRRSEQVLKFRGDSDRDRVDTQVQIAKLEETVLAMKERSVRTEVVAPIAGVVNKLFVNTIGGVVKSGDPLIQLVPAGSSVAVEARLSPADRAQVWPGLPAVVKVSAYDFSVYGGLQGKVVDISPDALPDEKGQPYFRVRLEADGTAFGADKPVVPGMLADVNIISGKQTVLEALVRPVRRIQENALR